MGQIAKTSVLFVCMGNICRSPMAEGIFKAQIEQDLRSEEFIVDSAGTGAWHEGDLPDPRGMATMKRYGIDISHQRSRPIRQADFETFDLILAMDQQNLDDLFARVPKDAEHKIQHFMQYSLGEIIDIPDPYYGLGDGFERVYNMLREGCIGLSGKLNSA